MRGRRMGRPGLLGTAARTAVIAGTATAVSGNVARRQQAQAAPQAAPVQQVAAPAPAAPAPSADMGDMIAQLKQLGDLKAAGVIDEAEFTVAKAKLLAG